MAVLDSFWAKFWPGSRGKRFPPPIGAGGGKSQVSGAGAPQAGQFSKLRYPLFWWSLIDRLLPAGPSLHRRRRRLRGGVILAIDCSISRREVPGRENHLKSKGVPGARDPGPGPGPGPRARAPGPGPRTGPRAPGQVAQREKVGRNAG